MDSFFKQHPMLRSSNVEMVRRQCVHVDGAPVFFCVRLIYYAGEIHPAVAVGDSAAAAENAAWAASFAPHHFHSGFGGVEPDWELRPVPYRAVHEVIDSRINQHVHVAVYLFQRDGERKTIAQCWRINGKHHAREDAEAQLRVAEHGDYLASYVPFSRIDWNPKKK